MKDLGLTECDWEEIYYAIDTKIQALEDGKYGPGDYPCQNKEWVTHLTEIQGKIGPDGKRAIKMLKPEPCKHQTHGGGL
jgi:hypothetical protein